MIPLKVDKRILYLVAIRSINEWIVKDPETDKLLVLDIRTKKLYNPMNIKKLAEITILRH